MGIVLQAFHVMKAGIVFLAANVQKDLSDTMMMKVVDVSTNTNIAPSHN